MKTSELMFRYNDKSANEYQRRPHAIAGCYFDSGILFCTVCECAIVDHEPVDHTYSPKQIEFKMECRVQVGYHPREDFEVNFDKYVRGVAVEEDSW